MKKRYGNLIIFIVTIAILITWFGLFGSKPTINTYATVPRLPAIKPDYTDTIIPANTAPLNFLVQEPGTQYLIKIHSTKGEPIEVFSKTGKIKIPVRDWRSLLTANRGKKLLFDIYTKSSDDQWNRYKTITNTIAKEDIDSHVAYRLAKPIYNDWHDVGVYQRNLENYNESVIFNGESCSNVCVNCHSFHNNDPESMFIGIRSPEYGSSAILTRNKEAYKIGTKFGYTVWHPSGKLAVYSVNKARQFFHNAGAQVRDVIDLDSTLCYYIVDSQTAKTTDALSKKDQLQTYPAWSADGNYLYYCSAPILWSDRNNIVNDKAPEHYNEVKYDLMRISYNIKTDTWGEPKTILSADETGLSILLPCVSPDGRFLLFTMCDYGCFPVYRPSSDLYLMDLRTGEYHRLEINSKYSDSWHSFSSNSRWIAFSSKRRGGLFTRIYFCYIDKNGKVYKPFIMPQKDPVFYDSFLKTYSIPELITGEVKIRQRTIARAIRSSMKIEADVPITVATPRAPDEEPRQERE